MTKINYSYPITAVLIYKSQNYRCELCTKGYWIIYKEMVTPYRDIVIYYDLTFVTAHQVVKLYIGAPK